MPPTMTLPAETPRRDETPESRLSGLPDEESQAWLERLGQDHPGRDAAIAELHALLLRAARFEVNRRRAALPHLRGDNHDDLAHQSADDALTALLGKLSDFRGDSRFTTWAYKFALLEAAVKVRRCAWQGREIPLEEEAWSVLADTGATAHRQAEDRDALATLREEIDRCLTPHQRRVLVSITLNDVPIDVLAQRLETTRGALYKTLHDARRKLRAALADRGYEIQGSREEEEP
jgi:RNA polymerase sigma-70 factor (ECF subfamily)